MHTSIHKEKKVDKCNKKRAKSVENGKKDPCDIQKGLFLSFEAWFTIVYNFPYSFYFAICIHDDDDDEKKERKRKV